MLKRLYPDGSSSDVTSSDITSCPADATGTDLTMAVKPVIGQSLDTVLTASNQKSRRDSGANQVALGAGLQCPMDQDGSHFLFNRMQEDDDIEEGDLPEHKRSPPPIDFSKVDPSRPEELLKMSKKGKTLMVFATVSGDPTEKETEEITGLWQGSLFNANYDIQRFVVGSNRVIFMLRDGSMAWEVKDFLVGQERCAEVTVEGQVFPGKAGKPGDAETKTQNHKNAKTKTHNDVNTKKKSKKKSENSKPDLEGNRAKKLEL